MDDLRYGLRMLRKHAGFSTIAIVVMALGIGANTAIFSVADALLWKPLPLPEVDRLVLFGERTRGYQSINPLSPADFFDLQAQATTLERVAFSQFANVNISGEGEP